VQRAVNEFDDRGVGPNCYKVADIKLNQRVSLRHTGAELSSVTGHRYWI
jgi:hypothetical protein